MLGQGERNMILNQAFFTDMSSLTRDAGFTVSAQAAGSGPSSLSGRFTETRTQRWTVREKAEVQNFLGVL